MPRIGVNPGAGYSSRCRRASLQTFRFMLRRTPVPLASYLQVGGPDGANMPVGINIKMTRANPHREEVFEAIITDVDWQYLVDFRNEVNHLATAEWVAAGMPGELHVAFSAEEGLRVETPNKPSNAQVSEVLEYLRPFILRSEALAFERVMVVFDRYLVHPWLKVEMQRVRDRFSGDDQASMYQLSANDLRVNSPETLDLWLNAFRFHRDKRKAASFLGKSGREPDELMLAVFRSMLVGKVDALLGLGRMVTEFEGHSPSAKRKAT